MKKLILLFSALLLALIVSAPVALAQGNAKRGPATGGASDPELEKDSLHNLEVARQYFKLRKAYVAAIKRCEEVIAGNPAFSKMDEVLYIAGESSLRLSQGKGKQAASLSAEKLRDDAREYLTRLAREYPESSFTKQSADDLKALGGPKE
ncbi:MAG TPA: outer membrane protein assembly factor BamD [Pyrinomonadaceae bacterium]|jgi:outer membrane protein assembly factor BamD (BamD/ComL family)